MEEITSWDETIPFVATLFSAYATLSATVTILLVLYRFVPETIQLYVRELVDRWLNRKPKVPRERCTMIIEKMISWDEPNELFDACETYLREKIVDSAVSLRVSRKEKDENMTIELARGARFSDTFQGIHLNWIFEKRNPTNNNEDDNHYAAVDPYYEEEEEDDYIDIDNDIDRGSCPRTHFALSFNKEHKGKVLQSYFPLVIETSREILGREKDLMMHDAVGMFEYDEYESIGTPFNSFKINHPFTFDNLAMDPVKKKMIIDDLDRFVRRKDLYKDVGRAWKRGYLLYGPPGTGKSSLVVAMANYLKFDIYDLQLTRFYACWRSGEYAELLKMIPSRSIILVEDIDHQGQAFPYEEEDYEGYDNEGDEEENESDEGEEQDDDVEGENESEKGDEQDGVEEDNESGEGDEQDDVEGNGESGEGDEQDEDVYYDEDEGYYNQNQGYYEKPLPPLAPLLNFLDGLLSVYAEERIFVFTTNYKERLDPALVRPGRMDMQIHMSYLTMPAFKVLARNYHNISTEHCLFKDIEKLLEITEATPAEVAEELLRAVDADTALKGVVELLERKKSEAEDVSADVNN